MVFVLHVYYFWKINPPCTALYGSAHLMFFLRIFLHARLFCPTRLFSILEYVATWLYSIVKQIPFLGEVSTWQLCFEIYRPREKRKIFKVKSENKYILIRDAKIPGFSTTLALRIFWKNSYQDIWSRDKQKLIIPGFFTLSFGISLDVLGFIMLYFRTFLPEHFFLNTFFRTPVSEHMFLNTCFRTTVSEHLLQNKCFRSHVSKHFWINCCLFFKIFKKV